MHQVSFGNVLKEARIARGYDVARVSRDLRIRQDIIVAIENSDFDRMPSRGYTRNMVIAYARLVGLNPQEISRMYLDQEYAYQIGEAHRSAEDAQRLHQAGRANRNTSGRGRTGSFDRVRGSRSAQPDTRNQYDGSSNGMGRRVYSQNIGRTQTHQPQLTHTARRTAMSQGKYTNLYTQPSNVRNPNTGRNRIIVIVAIVVLVVALAVGLFLTHRTEPTTTIPVTGASSQASTETQADSTEETQQTTETAPTEFTFTYEVASGSETYIEVYVDGATEEAHDVSGPASQSYTCTGKLRFVCTETDGVTATLDGEEVELTTSSSGIVNQTFTLDEIVEEWNTANGKSSSSSSGSSSSTTGTSKSSSSSD